MRISRTKVFGILLALCMVFTMMPAAAFAEENQIDIYTADDLANAIKNQEDGQKWVLHAGTYNLGETQLAVYADLTDVALQNQTNWYFPILKSIEIVGEGDVTVTSDVVTTNGSWNTQNLVTVVADNVKITNVDFKCKSDVNKVIEVLGKNFELRSCTLLPVTDQDGQFSGSIYFSGADAGNTVVEDVVMYAWINASTVSSGTVTLTNVVQDFTDNWYAGYTYGDYGYAWSPGVSGDNVVLNGFTIKTDGKSEFIQQIMSRLRAGMTIELTEDIEVSEEVYITVDNVTINGNGHTITAADDFKTNASGQNNLVKIEADNVTLDDVNLVATDKNKHTLDVWGSNNVQLIDVTLDHENASNGAPLIVNGSEVTVSGGFEVVTGDNSWYGVNVDSKDGQASLTFAEDATLTFNDHSAASDKILILTENTGTQYDDPVITSKSDSIVLDKNDNGVYDIHNHDAVKVEAKAATCTDDGNVAYWYCESCGKYFSDEALSTEITKEQTIVKATGHSPIKVEAKAATETEDGNIEYWYCEVCGKYFSDEALTKEITKADTVVKATGTNTQNPTDPTKPTTPEQQSKPNANNSSVPQTGDTSNIHLWIALLLVSAAGVGGVILYGRRRKYSK